MNKDLISVIVPVYNVEKYISDCITSIIGQTYKTLEILVINDGSTDNSLEICKTFESSDSRITLIDKNNEGLSIAREIGISRAKGKFFVTVDSDDYLESDYIEKLHSQIIKYNADIALCARFAFDDTSENIVSLDQNIPEYIAVDENILKNSYARTAQMYQMSDSWNKMYNTEFVKNADVHFCLPRNYNGTDLLFNYSLLLHKPTLTAINEPLYHYRLTQNSRVRRKNKHLEIGFKYIFEQLMVENRKCQNGYKISNQIHVAYFYMMKYASQDILDEVVDLDENLKFKRYSQFINTFPTINILRKIQIWIIVPRNLKVFSLLLLTKSVKGIILYYKLRSFRR